MDTQRARSESVLVGFSGGKDSLAVLDLCVRSFARVECFFMYFVPELECVETQLDFARRRWGVTIHQYPHWNVARCLREGTYCFNSWIQDDLDEWKLRDVYDVARADTGIPVIATGAKRSDSMWRRRNLASTVHWTDVFHPIVEWSKLDVIGYLRAQNIPLPSSSGKQATGIDLSTPSLLWLHDEHPQDFKRLCEYFPLAETVVWRRQFGQVRDRRGAPQ